MSARDELRALQQLYPLPRGKMTSAIAELARHHGVDPAVLARLFASEPMPDPAEGNLGRLLSVGPEQLRQLNEDGDLAAGTLASSYLRACTTTRGSFVITVDLGFTHFIYAAARALAVALPERDAKGEGSVQFEDAASLIAELAWWYSVAKAIPPLLPEQPASPQQLELALALSRFGDLFFLAHELGHVWCRLVGRDMAGEDLPAPPSKRVNRREEHLADGFGLKLTLATMPFDRGSDSEQLAYAGAEFGFQLLRVMERLGIYPHDRKTHPSAQSRIMYLRELAFGLGAVRAVRRNSSQSLVIPATPRVADTIERIFDRTLRLIGKPPSRDLATLEEAKQLELEIEGELECVAEATTRADDAIFILFMGRIRSFGSLPAVTIASAHLAVQLRDSLRVPGLLATTHTDDELLAEQMKLDLLLAAVRTLRRFEGAFEPDAAHSKATAPGS